MAQYDTPPSIDPTTGRIPPYKQVLAQDPTTGNYTIKYEYSKKSSTTGAGLSTVQSAFPIYGATIVPTVPEVPETEVPDPVVAQPIVPPNPMQDRGGGRRDRDDFALDPFAPEETSVKDLGKIVNPNKLTQGIVGGIIGLAPSALGALIALGNADQQKNAVSELNRRASEGILGVNPDGTTVTNSEFSSLADSIYGAQEKFGILGFREELSPAVNSAIKASKFFGETNELTGEPSTSVANQLKNPQSFEQLMKEFEEERNTPFDLDSPTARDFIDSLPDTPGGSTRRSSEAFKNAVAERDAAIQSGDVEGAIAAAKLAAGYTGARDSATKAMEDASDLASKRRAVIDREEKEEKERVARETAAKEAAAAARAVDRSDPISNVARTNEVADKNGNVVTYTDRFSGLQKAVNFSGGTGYNVSPAKGAMLTRAEVQQRKEQIAKQKKEKKNDGPKGTTGGASKSKQRSNRALGRSRGFQSGGR